MQSRHIPMQLCLLQVVAFRDTIYMYIPGEVNAFSFTPSV